MCWLQWVKPCVGVYSQGKDGTNTKKVGCVKITVGLSFSSHFPFPFYFLYFLLSYFFPFTFILFLIMWIYMHLYGSMHLWGQLPMKARREGWISVGWKLNLGPLQEEYVLLTPETFFFFFSLPHSTVGQATLEFFIFLPLPWDYKGATP